MAPSTRSRRPAQRQPSASYAAVWITDLMLCRAIEQYQRRCISSVRCITSNRGPLESRPRLGKRHMTGIMASPPTYRSPWYFEVIGNQNEWKWQAPTTAQERREKEAQFSLSGLRGKIVQWLEDSDLDKPYLRPPDDSTATTTQSAAILESRDIAETHTQTGMKTETADIVSSTTKPIPEIETSSRLTTPESASLAQEISDLRTSICQLSHPAPQETLRQLQTRFSQMLAQRIQSGNISEEELRLAMQPLDSVTKDHISNNVTASTFMSNIQNTLRAQVSSMREDDPQDMFMQVWTTIVQETCRLEAKNSYFRSFAHLISVASPSDRARIPREELLRFAKSFITTQATRLTRDGKWLMRHSQAAQTISLLETAHDQGIEEDMQAFINSSHSQSRDIQYSWMLIMSHRQNLCQDSFSAILQEFVTAHGALRCLDVWQLSLARLKSTSSLTTSTHRNLMSIRPTSLDDRWLSTTALLNSNQLQTLCRILWQMRKADILGNAIVTSCLTDPPRNNSLRVLDQIIQNPTIESRITWASIEREKSRLVLALKRSQQQQQHDDYDIQARITRFTNLMTHMALRYLSAPDLGDRKALRGIELCLKTQLYVNRTRVPDALVVFLKHIIGDMERGEAGRTTRLNYLIRKVLELQSPAEAKRVLDSIQELRDINWHRKCVQWGVRP